MTNMIFFYITLAADFLKKIFYDLQFETDSAGTSVVEKNVYFYQYFLPELFWI